MMSWNAERGIMRAPSHEHTGIAPTEAARRIIALNSAAQSSGVTKNVAEHLARLAPILAMLPLEDRNGAR